MKLSSRLLLCLVLISSWLIATIEAQNLLSNVLGTVFATPPPSQTHADSPPATIEVAPVAAPRTEVPSPAPVDAVLLPVAPLSPETKPILPATPSPTPMEQPSPSPPTVTLPEVTIPATLTPPSRTPQSLPPPSTPFTPPPPPPPSSPPPTRTPAPTPSTSLPSSPPTPTTHLVPTPVPTPPRNVPVAPTRNPSVPLSTTATPTTKMPLAPTRLPVASKSATAQLPHKPELLQLAPKRSPITLKHNATMINIRAATKQETRLAPTRVRASVTTSLPAVDSTKCGESESNRMDQYYLKNKQLQDDCTRAAKGYTFPFSGVPSRDQTHGMMRSNACVLLLKGISQVLPTDCVLGGVPVRRTAATILLSAGESSQFTHEASRSGSLMGSKSGAEESVKLSADLEIVPAWQNTPVRGDSAAAVHGDVAISTELQPDTTTSTTAFAPPVYAQAKTKEATESIAAHTLSDSATSAVPPSMRWMALCLGTLVLGNTLVLLL